VDPTVRPAWMALDTVRKQFQEDYAIEIRNNFSHHLGERDDYVAGIDRCDADHVVLFETLVGRPYAGLFRATWDALFRARDIDDNKHDEFTKNTKKAHNELPQMLMDFFRVVLEARAVPVTFESGPARKS
jgi:hypothetical protein